MAKNTQNSSTQENDSTSQEGNDRTKNTVRLMGALRETTLTHTVVGGKDVISGRLTVSFGDFQSQEVRFYTYKYAKDGKTEVKLYGNLLQLLPTADGCITLATLFKNNKDLRYDDAVKSATKVVVMAEMEEDMYVDRNGVKVSKTALRGRFASRVKNEKTYVVGNSFGVQGYVLHNFTNPNTNRVTVTLGIPAYDDSVNKVEFITPEEDDSTVLKEGVTVGQYAQALATSVAGQFAEGTTVTVYGYMRSAKLKTAAKAPVPTSANTFGYVPETKPQTSFSKLVWENVIYGGENPLQEGEEGALTEKEIKDGLAIKEANFEKRQAARKAPGAPKAAPAGAADTAAPAAAKGKGFKGFGFAPSTSKGAPTVSEAADPADAGKQPDAPQSQSEADAADVAAKVDEFDF